jgi:hypothetical protein
MPIPPNGPRPPMHRDAIEQKLKYYESHLKQETGRIKAVRTLLGTQPQGRGRVR